MGDSASHSASSSSRLRRSPSARPHHDTNTRTSSSVLMSGKWAGPRIGPKDSLGPTGTASTVTTSSSTVVASSSSPPPPSQGAKERPPLDTGLKRSFASASVLTHASGNRGVKLGPASVETQGVKLGLIAAGRAGGLLAPPVVAPQARTPRGVLAGGQGSGDGGLQAESPDARSTASPSVPAHAGSGDFRDGSGRCGTTSARTGGHAGRRSDTSGADHLDRSRHIIADTDGPSQGPSRNPVTYVDDWAVVGQDVPATQPPFRDLTSVTLNDDMGSWDPTVPLRRRLDDIREEEARGYQLQPRAFDDGAVSSVSDAVRRHYAEGGSMGSFIARAQAARSAGRMQPEGLRVVLAHYPRLHNLLLIAHAVVMHLDPRFSPVPVPRYSKKYSEQPSQSLVNAKLAKDALKGHYLLLDHAAADMVRSREHGRIHDNPLSWVPKSGSETGRLTTNCSYGVAGGYAESINHRTMTDVVNEIHGEPTVDSISDLAAAVLAANGGTGSRPAIGVADASGAFTWIDLHFTSALLLTSGVIDERVGMAIPLSANFGYTSTPTWWREVADAISWVVRTAPVGWYRRWMHTRDPSHAIIQPQPESHRRRPLGEESVHDVLQSLLAAMALVVCPMDPASPVVNLDKVRPGNTTSIYVGWVVDASSLSVRLSWRGMRKMLRALFVIIPKGTQDTSLNDLQSVVGVLQHYSSLWPPLGCLLQSCYHLIKRFAPRRSGGRRSRPTRVPLGDAVATDLRCWRSVATTLYNNPDLACLPIEMAAGRAKSTRPPVDTDACTVGAGAFHPGTLAVRSTWTQAELDAVEIGKSRVLEPMPGFFGKEHVEKESRYDICLLEFAWVVFTVLRLGPTWLGSVMQLRCDNTAAVAWASRYRARNPAAHDLARLLAWGVVNFKIHLQAEYLPGVDNIDADALSRWHQAEMPALWVRRHPGVVPQEVTMDSKGIDGQARRLVSRAITGQLGPGWIERLPGAFARPTH